MNQSNNFTEGKITLPLLKFAVPVLFAMLLQSLYGAVDMMVVGNFGTTADVSAINTGSWIMTCITQIFNGMSMGTTILLGQRIGMKKEDTIGDVIGTGICLYFSVGVVIMVLMETFSRQIADIMQTPEEAFRGTILYLSICGGGLLFIVAYNLIGSLFRGLGNSKVPLITVAIATVFNIAGDLILVGGFHMGVVGAAVATVAAQALSVVFSLVIIKHQGFPYSFGRKNIRFHRPTLKQTLNLGIPVATQDTLISISFLVITAIVNSVSVEASAGLGVAEKLCGFIMLVPSAFMQSMSAFVSQNIGAGKWNRALKTLGCGLVMSVIAGTTMALITFFHGDAMAYLFAADKPEVVALAFDYLKAYAIDTFLVSFMFCFAGFFNGCGKTRFVMLQGIIGAFCVRIPVSILMKNIQPVSLFRIGLATPCSSALQLILCFIYFGILLKQQKQGKLKLIQDT